MGTMTKVMTAAGIAVMTAGCASTPQGCAHPNYGGAVIGSQVGCE